MAHKYLMRPSHHDVRDGLYPHPLLALALPVFPPKFDVKKYFSPIRDQGVLGSCALEAYVAFLEFKKLKPVVKQSILFPYYNVRVMENSVGYDAGAEPRDVFKSAIKNGECANKFWPYYIKKLTLKPSFKAYANAKIPAITSFHAINTVEEVKTILVNGWPVYIGMAVYDSFEGNSIAQTGIMPMPKSGEKLLGYHAVVVGGYDDTKQRWLVRNSWGGKWGYHGYFYMPYEYFLTQGYITEKWTIIV